MAEPANNSTSRWQKIKTKFLSLTLRAQIFTAISVLAAIVVLVVGATTIITVSNPDAVAGVSLRFEPTALTRTPGQQLVVQLFVDTAGRPVNAVNATFDFDSSRMDIICNSASDCPGVVINSAWETIAQLSRSGSRMNISLGTTSPVSGDGVLIGTFTFTIPSTATGGDANVTFDETLAAVIEDDGFGTNILETVQHEEWTVNAILVTNGISITSGPLENLDCTVPQMTLTWVTNEISDSNVAYSTTPCPNCSWDQFVAAGASVVSQDAGPGNGTQNHQVTVGLSSNTTFYYRVMSTSEITGSWTFSNEGDIFSGCVAPQPDQLTITNLTVTPSSRSAAVTWNTSVLANSEVYGLSPSNTRGVSSWEDVTQTLSHSMTATNLSPATSYCLNVRSETLQVVSGATSATDSICFVTEPEDLSLDSNIVLKVNRDRSCGQWLSCASSVLVEDIQGEERDLCFDYTLCEELDPENNGECIDIVDAYPGSGAPLEYTIVYNNAANSSISLAKNLTGYSNVGAKWRGSCSGNANLACGSDFDCQEVGLGTCDTGGDFQGVGDVSGLFPVPVMAQLGSSHGITNGDFEAGYAYPWQSRFESEDAATVQTIVDRSVLSQDYNNILSIKANDNPNLISGTIVPLSKSLSARVGSQPLQYYVSFDTRSADQNIQQLIVQFGFHCKVPDIPGRTLYDYTDFTQTATDVIQLSSGWQRVIAGPLEFSDAYIPNPDETTCLAFLVPIGNCSNDGSSCSNSSQCGGGICAIQDDQFNSVYLDNVQIQPVLNVRPGGVSPETHITRTCRQYPSEDSPVCRYFDVDSGRELQGWEGYCLQTDPRNPRRCIQWAPIDLVAGSSAAMASYGQAGYGTSPGDRLPLYYCTQSRGNGPYEHLTSVRTSFNSTYRFLYFETEFRPPWRNDSTTVSTGFTGSSGMIDYDLISDVSTGRSFTTEGGANENPIYIYDIEQIVIDVYDAEAADWPRGNFSLNHGNDFETAWCGGTGNGCPESQNSLFNPDNRFYWKNVVQNIDTDGDGTGSCSELPGDGATNMWGAEALFVTPDGKDPVTGEVIPGAKPGAFLRIQAGLCDDSPKTGWMAADIIIYLREWCTEVAQVVNPFGENTAWAERVHNNLYSIPGIGYTLDRDLNPFGGIVTPQPDYNPSQWDYSDEEIGRQPLLVEPADKTNFPNPPHQARASSPYGGVRPDVGYCVGDTVEDICWSMELDGFIPRVTQHSGVTCETNVFCESAVGGLIQWCAPPSGAYGSECTSDEQCSDGQSCQYQCGPAETQVDRATCVSGQNVGASCSSNRDCGTDDTGRPGRCTGVVPPSLVDEDAFLGALRCTPTFSAASDIFARSEQVWRWDYGLRRYIIDNSLGWDVTSDPTIAHPPRVGNIEIKGGYGSSKVEGSTDIVFAEQNFGKVTISFNSIVDAEQVPLVRYTVDWGDGQISEESSLEIAPQATRPHVLTHTYIPDSSSSACNGTSCAYQPRIQIEDNWGWCSGGGANYSGSGSRCESWDLAPSRVVIGATGGGVPTGLSPSANAVVYTPGASPPHGTSISVSADQFVVLDGSASSDPDGLINQYIWHSGSQTGPVIGSQRIISEAFGSNTTVWLEVVDNSNLSSFASVSISVDNTPPPPSVAGWCLSTTAAGTCGNDADCNAGYSCVFSGRSGTDPVGKCSRAECDITAQCVGLYNLKCFEMVCQASGGGGSGVPCEPVGINNASYQGICPAGEECVQSNIIQ